MESLAPEDVESRDMLDVFCYLACMGPDAFERPRAAALLGLQPASRARAIERLLDITAREDVSRRIGTLLAERLTTRGAGAGRGVASLLPSLLDADTGAGFTVLKVVSASAGPSVARDLAEVLLSLTVAEATAAARRSERRGAAAGMEEPPGRLTRVRHLISALASLDLDPPARARLFLALSQTLQDAEVLRAVVLGSIFPSGTHEATEVLTEGNEDAIRAVLDGAASRPRGKAEFYEACKAVMALGVRRGLPALARVYRLIAARPDTGNLRAMGSMVRAAVLLSLEEATSRGRGLAASLPDDADIWTLHLLALVAPGLKEPGRSRVCEYLVDQAASRLRLCAVAGGECDAFVQVVVAASVLHAEPAAMGARVRRMVMDTAAALHVRAGAATTAGDGPTEVFRRVVGAVASEFRRRDALASTLAPVLPLVDGFAPGQPLAPRAGRALAEPPVPATTLVP